MVDFFCLYVVIGFFWVLCQCNNIEEAYKKMQKEYRNTHPLMFVLVVETILWPVTISYIVWINVKAFIRGFRGE